MLFVGTQCGQCEVEEEKGKGKGRTQRGEGRSLKMCRKGKGSRAGKLVMARKRHGKSHS